MYRPDWDPGAAMRIYNAMAAQPDIVDSPTTIYQPRSDGSLSVTIKGLTIQEVQRAVDLHLKRFQTQGIEVISPVSAVIDLDTGCVTWHATLIRERSV